MSSVTEHNTEKKRECNNSVQCRIGLPIRRYAIGVNQILEASSEFVCSVESRWILVSVNYVEEGRYRASVETLQ